MKEFTKASFDSAPNRRELENLQVAYNAACEAIVLLENDGALPLATKTVALFGNGANRTIKGGTGSGEVNERHSVSVLEGMENAGFEITTKGWISEYDSLYEQKKAEFNKNRFKKAVKDRNILGGFLSDFPGCDARPITLEDVTASNTDTCVYVLSRQAGEGIDRVAEKGDLFITDRERADIALCAEKYEKFILIINAGSQLDMKFLQEISGINAVLFMAQLGTAGGTAVADTLSGKVNPSGKLTDTWAKQYADIPYHDQFSYLNGNLNDEYYHEDIFVGYRYFDSFGVQPAYPFGYGKSYTDFAIQSEDVVIDGTVVTVNATVKNTGEKYSGKEVAQVYLSSPQGKLAKEYQSLAGFAKTDLLAPGETCRIKITFDITGFASYDEETASYILEKGEYIIRLGNSSRNTQPVAVIQLDETATVSRHQNICPTHKDFEKLTQPAVTPQPADESVPRLCLSAADIITTVYTYDTPAVCADSRVEEFINTLSVEEMMDIVIGVGMFGGERRFNMPGSVGNTTSKFWDRGLANVTLCDGPAGLRISKRAAITAKGEIKNVDMPFSSMESMPKFVKKFMAADPDKNTLLYQYTTAFPVATALAQTFNTDLLYQVGSAIFREMKEYGAVYWLAPALNIHRNPLCGRNFEYYSEDPFLSGVMAAAITKGVQQESGYYVTIKHYAANNQENNRNFVSSNISERALREIYLRGFEIAVRDGGAKGVMTSYNKINGIWAPNSYDLCTKVLRNEWGFDGVVMTDWMSTGDGKADNAMAMKAGNDLIMPGGKYYKKNMLAGLKAGRCTEEDIRRCCANVVKSIFDSPIQKEYIDNK